MKVLVSIHDVTPAYAAEVSTLWQLCAAVGVRPALLVVPNWHGEWPLAAHASFLKWVQHRMRDGAEVFLHGERHDEVGSTRRSLDHWRALGRTAGEGEFLTLSGEEAAVRIRRGLSALRACGLEPVGFVAPAWLAGPSCYRAVADAGLPLSESSSAVHLHRRGMHLPTPVIRWSARTPVRAALSCMVARERVKQVARHWLLRIALHPQDLRAPRVARSIRTTLARCLDTHSPWRYADL